MVISRPVAIFVGLVGISTIALGLRAYPYFLQPLLFGLAIGGLAIAGGVLIGLVAVGIKRKAN